MEPPHRSKTALTFFALLLDGAGLHAGLLALFQRQRPGARVGLGVALGPRALGVTALRVWWRRWCSGWLGYKISSTGGGSGAGNEISSGGGKKREKLFGAWEKANPPEIGGSGSYGLGQWSGTHTHTHTFMFRHAQTSTRNIGLSEWFSEFSSTNIFLTTLKKLIRNAKFQNDLSEHTGDERRARVVWYGWLNARMKSASWKGFFRFAGWYPPPWNCNK